MQTEPDPNFRKQFKSMFIKSLKLGFDLDDIRKKLRDQSYPSDLANKLIEELKSDKDIIGLIQEIKKPEAPKKQEKIEFKPEKKEPNFFQKIIKKLFKTSESKKIKYITRIHSLYYNIVIAQKTKQNDKYREIDEILQNPENKKLTAYFIKSQTSQIKTIQKNINKILKMAKSLVNIKLKPETKKKINKILEYVQVKNKEFAQELKSIDLLKTLSEEELKEEIQKQRSDLKIKENNLQKIIDEISRKSSKFKEAVSQI